MDVGSVRRNEFAEKTRRTELAGQVLASTYRLQTILACARLAIKLNACY
jgi:hypothetical protein